MLSFIYIHATLNDQRIGVGRMSKAGKNVPFFDLVETVVLRTAVHLYVRAFEKMCNFFIPSTVLVQFCLWIQKRACRSNVLVDFPSIFRLKNSREIKCKMSLPFFMHSVCFFS